MAYTPAKAWKDGYGAGATRLEAADLTHMEDGIAAATAGAEEAVNKLIAEAKAIRQEMADLRAAVKAEAHNDMRDSVNAELTLMNKRTSPVATIQMFAGVNAPDGWVFCNGAVYKQSDLPLLYAIIGNAYGGSKAAGTFAVPNFTYKMPVGWGEGAVGVYGTVGATGGEETHTLTFEEMPSHGHDIAATQVGWYTTGVFQTNIGSGDGWNYLGKADGSEQTRAVAANSGGGKAHNNMPPYMVIKFIIRTGEWKGTIQ